MPSNHAIFHTNQLDRRGTTVAIKDMAYWCREYMGVDPVIIYREDGEFPNDPDVRIMLEKEFPEQVIPYSIHHDHLSKICRRYDPTFIYRLYSGDPRSLQDTGYPNREFNHAVFGYQNDSIDAYISEWLRDEADCGKPYLPHVVDIPAYPNDRINARQALKIPQDAFVFGRIGGNDSFDLLFVKNAINTLLKSRNDVYFIMVNTDRNGFTPHPNLIFVDSIIDPKEKFAFIDACDAMIHARERGETFGLACMEFLSRGKPVLTYADSREKHHIGIIQGNIRNSEDFLYTKKDILPKLNSMVYNGHIDVAVDLSEFGPRDVIDRFQKLLNDKGVL